MDYVGMCSLKNPSQIIVCLQQFTSGLNKGTNYEDILKQGTSKIGYQIFSQVINRVGKTLPYIYANNKRLTTEILMLLL